MQKKKKQQQTTTNKHNALNNTPFCYIQVPKCKEMKEPTEGSLYSYVRAKAFCKQVWSQNQALMNVFYTFW